jgi:hypothetical protein
MEIPREASGAAKLIGILRLRRDFASLRQGSAQDDTTFEDV